MKISPHSTHIPVDTDLYLRLATVDDAPYLYHLINTHREYLRKWLPFIDYSMSVLDTKAYLRAVTDSKNISEEVYVILYQKCIAGIIGFKGIDHVNRKTEIGYWLSAALQGQGIMRRSCQTLLRHAFEEMSMNRVQIKVGIGNTKSSKIPQALGFISEGVQRDGEYLNGHFHDLEIYSLLLREWEQQN